jgi:hypothetical protein
MRLKIWSLPPDTENSILSVVVGHIKVFIFVQPVGYLRNGATEYQLLPPDLIMFIAGFQSTATSGIRLQSRR